MDPEEDSFHVSPIKSEKYNDKGEGKQDESKQVSKQQPTSNVTLSGVSEFDYMGGSASLDKLASANNYEAGDAESEEQEEIDPLKKSLEKDFREAAANDADQAQLEAVENDADEGQSPISPLDFRKIDDESPEFTTFKINPIHSYDKRPENSYNNK